MRHKRLPRKLKKGLKNAYFNTNKINKKVWKTKDLKIISVSIYTKKSSFYPKFKNKIASCIILGKN